MLTDLIKATYLLDSLWQTGCCHFYLAPGLRNAVLAFVLEKRHYPYTVGIEERGLSFLALNHAKVKKRPVAIICTSGSAVANFFSAILEARASATPLIFISADRPPEFVLTHSNQTLSQTSLFPQEIIFSWNILQEKEEQLSYLSSYYCLMIQNLTLGPIHFNFPLLAPQKVNFSEDIPNPKSSPLETLFGLSHKKNVAKEMALKYPSWKNSPPFITLAIGNLWPHLFPSSFGDISDFKKKFLKKINLLYPYTSGIFCWTDITSNLAFEKVPQDFFNNSFNKSSHLTLVIGNNLTNFKIPTTTSLLWEFNENIKPTDSSFSSSLKGALSIFETFSFLELFFKTLHSVKVER